MKYIKYFVALILIFCFSLPTFAHPGSTDEYGGHVDWNTGEYHYHHGFEAHYHTNGVCPYEFKDYADHTNHGSTSNNNYSYNYGDRDQYVPAVQYTLKPVPTPTPKPTSKPNQTVNSKQNSNTFDWSIFLIIIPVGFTVLWIKQEKAEKEYQQSLIAKKQYEEEKSKYTQLYSGKDILKVINAPPTAFIDSGGLPHQSVKNDDIFVIYLAPKQPRVFHRHKGCGKNLHKDNYINLRHYNRTITPCKKCCPTVPDTSWYYEYLKIKRIKKEYNIE